MTSGLVLAIDQGTSATKAVVVGPEGAATEVVEVPLAVSTGPDGRVEVDGEAMWASVVTAGTAALRAAGSPAVDAVALANQGETVIPWDRSRGTACGPGLVWQDRRAAPVCDRMRAEGLADELAAVTGLELDPYFVAPKLRWMRDHAEALGVSPGAAITTSDAFLLQRLAGPGAVVTDAATASRSLLSSLEDATWSPRCLQLFGLEVDDLPAIVPNDAVIGETSVFTPGRAVPVAGLAVDQQAALFAESCLRTGEAKCTYGTGAFLLATATTPIRSRHGLVSCVAWQLGDHLTWCLDGQVFTAGAAVSWLESVGLITDPADLDRLGGSVADTGGVTFVPALSGLAAPFWSVDARGSFNGLALDTTQAHLVRAVVEGIAAQVALLAGSVAGDLGSGLRALRVDGGLTRSTLLLQCQADLMGCPVEVYPSPHATALGVAALARLALGTVDSASAAVGAWRPAAVVEPRIGADEAAERLGRWRAAAEACAALGKRPA